MVSLRCRSSMRRGTTPDAIPVNRHRSG
jgi:hypothetical protein